ncbi:hypothetical protein [Paenarthrobacter histidinolovorans]|uniref:GNAT family N-acetyltransferase n=1 Tax=Paenarthrobacter histidinolovorans TaxID=43664 RepID=A0ABW8MZS7_9MICC
MTDDPRQSARNLLQLDTVTIERLWIRYWAEGGSADLLELDAYVHEALRPPAFELTLLGWATERLHGG